MPRKKPAPTPAPVDTRRWMVWSLNGNPTKWHKFRGDAEAEAERLARLHPGVKFYAVQSQAMFCTRPLLVDRTDLAVGDITLTPPF